MQEDAHGACVRVWVGGGERACGGQFQGSEIWPRCNDTPVDIIQMNFLGPKSRDDGQMTTPGRADDDPPSCLQCPLVSVVYPIQRDD